MTTARVVQERVFFPYSPYVDSATHFCSEMERKEYVSWYDLLAAMTLLGLSVEAIANTYGELLIPNFKDFESASPKVKLRVLCDHTGIPFNRNKTPLIEVLNLLKVRNQLAHPKYQKLHYESKAMPLHDAQAHYQALGEILHDVEKSLTPDLAHRSLAAVRSLASMLRSKLDPSVYQSSSKRLVIEDDDPQSQTA